MTGFHDSEKVAEVVNALLRLSTPARTEAHHAPKVHGIVCETVLTECSHAAADLPRQLLSLCCRSEDEADDLGHRPVEFLRNLVIEFKLRKRLRQRFIMLDVNA